MRNGSVLKFAAWFIWNWIFDYTQANHKQSVMFLQHIGKPYSAPHILQQQKKIVSEMQFYLNVFICFRLPEQMNGKCSCRFSCVSAVTELAYHCLLSKHLKIFKPLFCVLYTILNAPFACICVRENMPVDTFYFRWLARVYVCLCAKGNRMYHNIVAM